MGVSPVRGYGVWVSPRVSPLSMWKCSWSQVRTGWVNSVSIYPTGAKTLIGKLGGDAFAAIRLSQSMVGLLKAALEEGESAEAWKQTREKPVRAIQCGHQGRYPAQSDR